jgi:hypothetical protein
VATEFRDSGRVGSAGALDVAVAVVVAVVLFDVGMATKSQIKNHIVFGFD